MRTSEGTNVSVMPLEVLVIMPVTLLEELPEPDEGTLWVMVSVNVSLKVPVPPVSVIIPRLLNVVALTVLLVMFANDSMAPPLEDVFVPVLVNMPEVE